MSKRIGPGGPLPVGPVAALVLAGLVIATPAAADPATGPRDPAPSTAGKASPTALAPTARTTLPTTRVGDGRRTRTPARGSVVPCRWLPARAGAVPWVVRGAFVQSRQPRVGGATRLPGASPATVSVSGRTRVVRTGGLPNHPVGDFAPPVRESRLAMAVPANPAPARQASCLPQGPVGVLLSGAPVYAPMDNAARDTLAHGRWDACDGAPDAVGRYRYVRVSSCLPDRARGQSRLLGYALDGFGIYGPRDETGRTLTNADLDACHGRVGTVSWNGRRVRMYHYVATAEFPYTLGCFRGTPGRIVTASTPSGSTPAAPVPAQPPAAGPTPSTPTTPTPPPPLSITAPTLVPAYDREIADYTVRCTGGSVTLSVRDAPSGTVVAVDDGPASGLDRAATVSLVAGQRFDWTVTDALRTTTHHARCLPDDFPLWDTERSGAPQAEWYVFTPSLAFGPNDPGLSRYVSVVDARGVPVWWQNETRGLPLDGQILGGAEITWTIAGTSFALYGSYDIRGWDGRVTSTIGGTLDHHDLVRTERGTYLALSYVVRPCATDPGECIDVTGFDPGVPAADTAVAIVDGEVHEYSAAGTLIWSWSTRDHVDLAETARWYTSGIRQDGGGGPAWYDVVHLNSVEDDGDGVLISARHTDAVYRVLKATGEIDWKLGGTTTPRSLTVIGDTATGGLFGGQHDARRLPDGTVTVHDNGTGLNRAPRALRLSIDPGSRSATVIESLTDPRAPASPCCGSSRRLPGGNWVSAWGANPFVTEQAADGSAVLTMRFAGSAFSYRIAPTLPGVVAAADLRAGMDAMHPRNPGG